MIKGNIYCNGHYYSLRIFNNESLIVFIDFIREYKIEYFKGLNEPILLTVKLGEEDAYFYLNELNYK